MAYHSIIPGSADPRATTLTRKHPAHLPLRIIAGIAVLLTLGTTFLVIALSVFLAIEPSRPYALSIVAAISQVISLFALCFVVVRYAYEEKNSPSNDKFKGQQRRVWFILGFGILPSTLASVLVAATLGWSKASVTGMPRLIFGRPAAGYLSFTFIIWSLNLSAQAFFFVLLVFTRKPSPENAPMPLASTSTQEVPPLEMAEQSRPTTSTTVQSNPFRVSEYSAPPSLIASEGTTSLRSSLSTIQRPSLSKSRLLTRHSKNPTDNPSRRPSSSTPRASQDSFFNTWDTSSVSPHIRETVLGSTPPTLKQKLTLLEPIPGSRSPSPAKALEGPFFQPSPPESPPSSPLPQPSVSRPTSPLSQPRFETPPSKSRAQSEDHIHPLFRTCSPTPPPTASYETVITAAPSAGQIIDESMLRRMRSGSLPASPSAWARSSPSPLVRSESFDYVFTVSRNPISPNLGLGVNNSRPATSPVGREKG